MLEMTLYALVACVGFLMHFLKAIVQIRKVNPAMTATQYWKEHPYHTVFTLLATFIGFMVLVETNQLSYVSAFGIGYMADSTADMLGTRGIKKLTID